MSHSGPSAVHSRVFRSGGTRLGEESPRDGGGGDTAGRARQRPGWATERGRREDVKGEREWEERRWEREREELERGGGEEEAGAGGGSQAGNSSCY